MDKWINEFINPPTAYRGKPFWAWNGKLEEEELLRQVHVLKDMGFGGFFMHSRTGLETEYLGEHWFKFTSACTKEGAKLQLSPWIYDEDRWPSGSAGGLVTREIAFRRKILTLTLETEPVSGEKPLAVFSGQVEGLRVNSGWKRHPMGTAPKEGETLLVFRVYTMEPQSVYNGFTDADRLNENAMEKFLSVTHKQYAQQCKEEFDTICGVFTDEPHRGMVFSDFSDPGDRQNWSLPWTEDLPEAFLKAYGVDLLEQLPALFLQENGEKVALVKWQYMELLQKLFIQRYLLPIEKWAHAHGKKTTGHFLHEDSLMAQAVPTGSMMRCYPYLDEPGIDNLTENNYTPWAVKQLESVARQLGKQWKLSELYGATGWQMSFQDYKYVGDWQTVLGINTRCPHLSWYTMAGEAKRDYPGSFLHQATWVQEHNSLETYFARLGWVVSQGNPLCDTLVIHPVESLWCQIHPGWARGLEATDPEVQGLEQQFTQLFHWLMASQVDFDYGDEGLLAEHAHLEANNGSIRLQVGKACYKRIVVCGCLTLRGTTMTLLQAFHAQGGEVIFIGTPPAYVDCQKSDRCIHLAKKATRLLMRQKAVVEAFRKLPSPVRIVDAKAARKFYLQMREGSEGTFVILWNKSRRHTLKRVQVEVPSVKQIQQWDCLTGERSIVPVQAGKVSLDFAPGQERVLFLTEKAESLLPAEESIDGSSQSSPVLLTEPEAYALDEPNVLVLDCPRLWLDGKEISGNTDVLGLDALLRGRLGFAPRGGDMVQPWAREKVQDSPKPIRLRYHISMEHCPEAEMMLAVEPMEKLAIYVNGTRVPLKKAEEVWVDRCFTLYTLPCELWQKGDNVLELTATYGRDSGLESIFLLGNFGVWFRRGIPTLGQLPQKLKIGDLTHQGLPFYSGKVSYTFSLPKDGDFRLGLPKVEGSCAVGNCHGVSHCIPWYYHKPAWKDVTLGEKLEVQVVLNRRNTFGPLHRFPRKQPYIAPDSFTCEDKDRYCLYPMGLLQPPELYYL